MYNGNENFDSKRVRTSGSESSNASDCEPDNVNCYCIFLHVVEGINFHLREFRETDAPPGSMRSREKVIMNASLNGIQFEVEGNSSCGSETTIFNSNCVWECDLPGVKRLKTDNRPVKLVFYTISSSPERKVVGNLLLPLRGLPLVNNAQGINMKLFWHKLTCLGNEWRSQKPEVYLMLTIVKKSLLNSPDFEALICASGKAEVDNKLHSPDNTLTSAMMQSQANIYVLQLPQLGLLQVGNDPALDCDIMEVVLYLKDLKNINKYIKTLSSREPGTPLVVLIDFVGNVNTTDLTLNDTDCYNLSEKFGLRFKTSPKTLRLYFQRIFYLPINLYYNGVTIANYRMDFSKLLPPDDNYFRHNSMYILEDSFYFDRLSKPMTARDIKPSMDFKFHIEMQAVNSNPNADHTKLLLAYDPANDAIGAAPIEPKAKICPIPEFEVGEMRKLDACSVVRVEELGRTEKVAAWCEEVIKTHQLMQSKKSVRERALDWPPRNSTAASLSDRDDFDANKNTATVTTRATNFEKPEKDDLEYVAEEEGEDVEEEAEAEDVEPEILLPPPPLLVAYADVAINTDPVKIVDNEEDPAKLQLNAIEELKAWKLNEMEKFDRELKRKEMELIKNVKKQCLEQRRLEQAELGTNINKCAEIEEKLEKIENALSGKSLKKAQLQMLQLEQIKLDLKETYERRLGDLEAHITRLKSEMEQQLQHFQIKVVTLQEDNTQLVHNKLQLMERQSELEAELAKLKLQEGNDSTDLRKLLNELCVQNERYLEMEKAKDFYKKQWRRCAHRMQRLKIALLDKQENELALKIDDDFDLKLDIREIITSPTNTPAQESDNSNARLKAQYVASAKPSSATSSFVSGSIDESFTD